MEAAARAGTTLSDTSARATVAARGLGGTAAGYLLHVHNPEQPALASPGARPIAWPS